MAAMHEFMASWNNELIESGEFVDARGLAAPVHEADQGIGERRAGGDRRALPETQEVLEGYTIVECDSFDRATEIAPRVTKSPGLGDANGAYIDVFVPSSRGSPTGDVTTGAVAVRSRTCCVSWRRRSLARWCAVTATSTWPRTRSRKYCRRRAMARPGDARQPTGADHGCLADLTDLLRSKQARQRREEAVARWTLPDQWLTPGAD